MFETKPTRGPPYTPTPERFDNAKCGWVNIKNEDLERFKRCVKYHQPPQGKTDSSIAMFFF